MTRTCHRSSDVDSNGQPCAAAAHREGMTKHTALHRKTSHNPSGRLPVYLRAARGILQDVGAIVGILSAIGILPFGK